MIRKLLLVRLANSKSTLLEEAGVASFHKGKPLNLSPLSPRWPKEAGLSHYGYLLQDLKLKDLQKLEAFVADRDGLTILNFEGDMNKVLTNVGLQINDLAE